MEKQTACINMLQHQIQPAGVSDHNLLNLIHETPRTLFVPPMYRNFAFTDVKLPLSNNKHMLTPCEEAQIITHLNPKSDDTVLEVGTGSGYLTALLAKSTHHIFSIDMDPHITQQVAKCLARLHINNATLVTGNAIQGWHAQSHYDIILVNGSIPFMPKALCQHLGIGGRLFAVVGQAPAMNGMLLKRLDESDDTSSWHLDSVFNTYQTRIANPMPDEPFTL